MPGDGIGARERTSGAVAGDAGGAGSGKSRAGDEASVCVDGGEDVVPLVP